ncbi:MAG: hypothetical protein IT307_20155, partial [Chloroflexi bacterium]|nr:hypothetical protein [Chloroflexota bacterium]
FRFAEGDRDFNANNVDKLFTAPAGDRAALDVGLGLFSADGHTHGNNAVVEALSAFLKTSTKTAGQDVTDHFRSPPFGWPGDLLRYVAAAMFVDGKLSAIDRNGSRYDDPRAPAARALFGTLAFRTTRLEVEEEALTPAESSQARTLLTDLGQVPADGGEIALRDAAKDLYDDLRRRLGVVERARAVELPLPGEYDQVSITLDALGGQGSRVKVVRALLAHEDDLRKAASVLDRLEQFATHHGLEQFDRSQRLLAAALQAGLVEDATWGEQLSTARDELRALVEQRRVLDEWDAAYQTYRERVLEIFKAVYVPLRDELAHRIREARTTITTMPEYEGLSTSGRSYIRADYLADGQPLGDLPGVPLKTEEQLLAANADYSIGHMRAALAAVETQVGRAQAAVIERYGKEQEEKGQKAKIATWSPSRVFSGKRFATAAEVDAAFDAEKERLKMLIAQGKTIQVV